MLYVIKILYIKKNKISTTIYGKTFAMTLIMSVGELVLGVL